MKALIAAAILAALALAGCGTASSSASRPAAARTPAASPSPAAATQAPPGPQRFIADIQAAGYGSKDVSTSAASLVLLSVGKDVCRALTTSQGTNIEGYATMIESL